MGLLARMQTLPYYNYNKILRSDYVCHARVSGQYMCCNVSVALEWVPLNEKTKQKTTTTTTITNKQTKTKQNNKKETQLLSVYSPNSLLKLFSQMLLE